jgi:uncharacterized protein (TIGR00156 family)
MQKIITAATLTVALATSSLALAAFNDGKTAQLSQSSGGFNGPTQGVVLTIKEALEAHEDTPVQLTGNIISALGNKNYLFKDTTGEITVEISNKHWKGQTITPTDKIQLLGEVEKTWNSVEIDVESMQKL